MSCCCRFLKNVPAYIYTLQLKLCEDIRNIKISFSSQICRKNRYFAFELFILSIATFSLTFYLVFNLVSHPFNGELFFHTKSVYSTVGEDQAGVKVYCKIVDKKTRFTCILIYTSMKVIFACFANGLDAFFCLCV